MLDFRPVPYRDPDVFARIVALERLVFPELSEQTIRHILLDAHGETLVIGCFDGDAMVGLNAFLAHPVCWNGITGLAYQSCLSATDPDYRGRRIFPSIINAAKEELRARGAAFMFGYPNHNSGPIFVQKLGFHLRPMVALDLPAALLKRAFGLVFAVDRLSAGFADLAQRVNFDAHHAADWKASSPHGAPIAIEDYTNFAFVRKQRAKLSICRVGGYEINKPPLLGRLLAKAAAQTGSPIVRLVVPVDSPLYESRRVARVTRKTEPLIDFPLAWPSSELRLEAWNGIKDVF